MGRDAPVLFSLFAHFRTKTSRNSCLLLNWSFLWALCFSSTLVLSEQKCFLRFQRIFNWLQKVNPLTLNFSAWPPWEKTGLLVWGTDLAWWLLINIKHLNDLANKCTRYRTMHIQGDSLIYVTCSVLNIVHYCT